jgi:hypothetical protein
MSGYNLFGAIFTIILLFTILSIVIIAYSAGRDNIITDCDNFGKTVYKSELYSCRFEKE